MCCLAIFIAFTVYREVGSEEGKKRRVERGTCGGEDGREKGRGEEGKKERRGVSWADLKMHSPYSDG